MRERLCLLTGALFLLTSCLITEPVNNNKGLEHLVTCNFGTKLAKEFHEYGDDPEFADPNPNNRFFFVPKEKMFAFGYPVTSYGFVGIEFARGPNVYLDADPSEVSEVIGNRVGRELRYVEKAKMHATEFKNSEGRVVAMIAVMPRGGGTSAVICASIPGR